MLDALRFVQGAVAKRDFVPTLTHFLIRGGYVIGHNGDLSICAPLPVDLDMAPRAVQFIKAIRACEETIALHRNTAGQLVVRSGKFTTHVDCVDASAFPDVMPTGDAVPVTAPLLPILTKLEPFIGIDASRPWACGVLFFGHSAYATNNVSLIEHWIPAAFPATVNVPHTAVKELLRIGEEPLWLQVNASTITFHFEGGRWLSTKLSSLEWPDIPSVLNSADPARKGDQFPPYFFETLEKLCQFTDELNRVWFHPGYMATVGDITHPGTFLEAAGLPTTGGCYNAELLTRLKGVATTMDLEAWPGPAFFYGDGVRGAVLGYRG